MINRDEIIEKKERVRDLMRRLDLDVVLLRRQCNSLYWRRRSRDTCFRGLESWRNRREVILKAFLI